MIKKIIIIIILLPIVTLAQLTVINPGLEGPTGWGITPEPWQNCMPFGFSRISGIKMSSLWTCMLYILTYNGYMLHMIHETKNMNYVNMDKVKAHM